MTYVYLIESTYKASEHYVGVTTDLKQRISDHNQGRSRHTCKFKPWYLVAYLGFADPRTAHAFESYLKTGSGKAFLSRHFLPKAHMTLPRPHHV